MSRIVPVTHWTGAPIYMAETTLNLAFQHQRFVNFFHEGRQLADLKGAFPNSASSSLVYFAAL